MADQSNYHRADEIYESKNDDAANKSGELLDNSYVSSDNYPVPVQEDSTPIEDSLKVDPNSDAALVQDEKEAIDKSNIIKERTRGATVTAGAYSEGRDEDDLPEPAKSGDSGRSSTKG